MAQVPLGGLRSVLDILKTNSKLEKVYHQTAQRAFEFCVQHERKRDAAAVRDVAAPPVEPATSHGASNTNRLRGWEGWTQRASSSLSYCVAQLEAASAQLWTEGFRTVEDIHQSCASPRNRRRPSSWRNITSA